MPVAESSFTISAGAAAQQAFDLLDGLSTLVVAAGWGQVYQGAHSGTAHRKAFRATSTDVHRTNVGLLHLYSQGTSAYLDTIFDWDIEGEAGLDYSVAVRSQGQWSTSGYPASGAPTTSTGLLIGRATIPFTATTAQTIDVHAIADETGLFFTCDSSGGTLKDAAAAFLPLGTALAGREIYLDGEMTGSTVTFPHATSLSFKVMGQTVTPTFPTATPLTPWKICRVINAARPGLLEAYPIKLKAGTWVIRVRIPPTQAAPAAFSVANRNTYRLQLSYQHASLAAAGINFALLLNQSFTTISGTTRGTLSDSGISLIDNGARIGSLIYNRTEASTAEVEAFASLGTGFVDQDTVIVDSIPGSWDSGDAYDIYPVCDYSTGCDGRSGQSQIINGANPASDIPSSASVTVLCSDIYGEMYDHFKVGQKVLVANNGCAQVLQLATTPTVELGEVIDGSDGCRGVVRGIEGNYIVVDTFKGPTTATNAPWGGTISRNTDPDNPREGGSATGIVISSVAGSTNTGWATWATILSKSVSSAVDGDFRTKLGIQTNQNGSFVVSPGATIGSPARTRVQLDLTGGAAASASSYITPWLYSSATVGEADGSDVRGSEASNFTSEPNYAPDEMVQSTDLGEIWFRPSSGPRGLAQLLGSCPHLRSINDGTVTQGDVLVEDGDTARQWLAVSATHADGGSGGSNGNNAGVICIGPGSSSFTGSGI